MKIVSTTMSISLALIAISTTARSARAFDLHPAFARPILHTTSAKLSSTKSISNQYKPTPLDEIIPDEQIQVLPLESVEAGVWILGEQNELVAEGAGGVTDAATLSPLESLGEGANTKTRNKVTRVVSGFDILGKYRNLQLQAIRVATGSLHRVVRGRRGRKKFGLNSPPVVAASGIGLAAALHSLGNALSSAPLPLLRALNAAAFAVNVAAASVPGRLDGPQDEEMRRGVLHPQKQKPRDATPPSEALSDDDVKSPLAEEGEGSDAPVYRLNRSRTLVKPSRWAFAIWGPLYLGEAAFVAAALLAPGTAATDLLLRTTAPFVVANLFQSLWCASFRANHEGGWRYVGSAMLAGKAYGLSRVHAAGMAVAGPSALSGLLVPLTMKFGWATAAIFVNLNGALASDETTSPTSLVALGKSSALAATALGVGVTLARSAPTFGLTLVWALAACADGLAKRIPSESAEEEEILARGASVQRYLCWIGSLACAVAAGYAGVV